MHKVKRGRGTWRCVFDVLESHHSPVVLVGAPTQGCSSTLIRARIKCSLRTDSLTLRRGESPTTAHIMTWVIYKLRQMITKLSITTKPSRWWRSPRVTSTNSHLTKTSLMKRWMHTCYSLCTNNVLNLGFSNLNHPTRFLLSLALQSVSSAEQMGKRVELDE
jgi:hypothetical protein